MRDAGEAFQRLSGSTLSGSCSGGNTWISKRGWVDAAGIDHGQVGAQHLGVFGNHRLEVGRDRLPLSDEFFGEFEQLVQHEAHPGAVQRRRGISLPLIICQAQLARDVGVWRVQPLWEGAQ